MTPKYTSHWVEWKILSLPSTPPVRFYGLDAEGAHLDQAYRLGHWQEQAFDGERYWRE
jgi:hypothetical protein